MDCIRKDCGLYSEGFYKACIRKDCGLYNDFIRKDCGL